MENKADFPRQVVAIVDAVSAGALVTEEMADYFDLIHIESDGSVNALSHPRFHKHLFKAFYRWDINREDECLQQIARHEPLAVIPGNESAVALSERLAWSFSREGNDPANTSLRRNKFLMNGAAERAGLRIAKQAISDDADTLKSWFRQHGGEKAVVKPLDSAGSDDVYICTTEAEVEAAVRKIAGKQNSMHSRNDQALIQQFIEGTEYVVNTVSLKGRHKVTDVWRVSKKLTAGRNLYDFDELCDPCSLEAVRCIEYTLKVLDAVGIVKGAGHTELILAEEGPTLLEIGARASGAANPKAIRLATGSDQLEVMRFAYTRPDLFNDAANQYMQVRPLRCVHSIASQRKPFSHVELQDFLAKLPGFVSVMMKIADGTTLRPTTDVSSCPAAFFLTGGS
ncbi:TPA: ATP-grasp domain-containing protein, partial [Serratia marcescens]|nr:ATP-grasp domain-containing protein [Serratia marcescens]